MKDLQLYNLRIKAISANDQKINSYNYQHHYQISVKAVSKIGVLKKFQRGILYQTSQY